MSNLLTNAAKYSDPESTVHVRGRREGAWIRLSVRDEGVGLPPDLLNRVFDIFFQQPQSIDRSKGGLGLGLAIVRSLTEMHGGRVSAFSDGPGKGSEFIVELPAQAAVETRGAAVGSRRGRESLRPSRLARTHDGCWSSTTTPTPPTRWRTC